MSTPKGFAIHLGITNYCRLFDGCLFPDLPPSVIASARALAGLSVERRFESPDNNVPSLLLNAKATRANLTHLLDEAKPNLGNGEYLVITFSGYGLPPLTGQHGWMLYDDRILFDELFKNLMTFSYGVRIFVISMSCFSGAIQTNPQRPALLGPDAKGPTIIHLAAAGPGQVVPADSTFGVDIADLANNGHRNASFEDFKNALIQLHPGGPIPELQRLGLVNPPFEAAGPFNIV